MSTEKRNGGLLDEQGNRLVLTQEGTETDEGWTHNCGEDIISADVKLSHRNGLMLLSGDGRVRNLTVPFCPNCENKPVRGVFGPGVRYKHGFNIDQWEH